MTDQPADQPTNQPPAAVPGWTPPPAPEKPKKPLWQRPWFLIVAGIIAIAILGNAFGGNRGTQAAPASSATATQATSSAPEPTATETEDEADEVPATLTKDDFKLKMKITKKQCFGSAGCNVSIKVDVAYAGAGEVDDLPSNISITFDVKGAEDGVYTSTIDLEDGRYSPDTTVLSTRSSKSKLSAKITDIEASD